MITENSGSAYPQCEFIRLDDIKTDDTSNEKDRPEITISLANNKQTEIQNERSKTSPVKALSLLDLLSEDNRVKITLDGSFIISDGVQNVNYRLNLGNKGIVNNYLNELLPRIEIIFNCGMITMYFTEYESRNFIYMMTGELANGHIKRDSGNFLWRTPDVRLQFPSNDKSHYFCDQAMQFDPVVYQGNEAYKIQFQMNLLEYEINRSPASDPDSYSTHRGKWHV